MTAIDPLSAIDPAFRDVDVHARRVRLALAVTE
jgi:hypothetical protein